MKSLIMKSVYAGLGLVGSGEDALEHLVRQASKRADLSEKDGEKIVRRLRGRFDKALDTLHSSIEKEINKAVSVLHSAARPNVHKSSAKKRVKKQVTRVKQAIRVRRARPKHAKRKSAR